MRLLLPILLLLSACATGRTHGWQDAPTDAQVRKAPIILVVFGWPLSFITIGDLGHWIDQSGDVGSGETRGQADQKTDVDADAEVDVVPGIP